MTQDRKSKATQMNVIKKMGALRNWFLKKTGKRKYELPRLRRVYPRLISADIVPMEPAGVPWYDGVYRRRVLIEKVSQEVRSTEPWHIEPILGGD